MGLGMMFRDIIDAIGQAVSFVTCGCIGPRTGVVGNGGCCGGGRRRNRGPTVVV